VGVITYPNEVLRIKSTDILPEEIQSDEIQSLIDGMILCMAEHNGLGLSACQVGSNKNIFVCTLRKEGVTAIINPEVLARSGHYKSRKEGCLSVPNVRKDIKRSELFKINYFDREGKPQTLRKTKFEASILQHEMDHLKGKLIIDY